MADFQPWNALKQGFGVGMVGLLDECLDWCSFDDAPQIHHDYAIRDMFDDADIMADEQICEVVILLEFHKQVQHLRLNRDVKSGDGFITHKQLR